MRPCLWFRPTFWVTTAAILVSLTLAPDVRGQDGCMVTDTPQAPVPDAGAAAPRPTRTVPPRSRIQISDARLRRTAESAVRAASTRIAAGGCRGLLSEFADQHGQPLETRLAALQMSLEEYLQAVVFVDGRGHRLCQGPVAVTMPGSRVVYLCGGLTRESPSDAWVTILHEVLHSLGLGENPPTPAFIADRVRARCR